MNINQSLMVDNSDSDEKRPRFVESKCYQAVLDWLCQLPDERDPKTITSLAKAANVSREMVYRYMRHPYTKRLVREYIESLSVKDQVKVYDNITELSKTNPRAVRLWHELYQDWNGPGDRSGGKIIVNLAIFNENKNYSTTMENKKNREILE